MSDPTLKKFGPHGAQILASLLGSGAIAANPAAAQSNSTPARPAQDGKSDVQVQQVPQPVMRVAQTVYGPPPSMRDPEPVPPPRPMPPAPVYGPPPTMRAIRPTAMNLMLELPWSETLAATDFVYAFASAPQWIGDDQLIVTIPTTVDERSARDPKRYVFAGAAVEPEDVTVVNVMTFRSRIGNDGPLRPMTRVTLKVAKAKPARVGIAGMVDALNEATFQIAFREIAPIAPPAERK